MLIIFVLLLLETAMAADILLNSDWEKVLRLGKHAWLIYSRILILVNYKLCCPSFSGSTI